MSSQKQQKVRIVCVSDTHNQTPSLPAGDILIHAGDLTNQGTEPEIQRQIAWLQSQRNFKAKIIVAGNHDMTLDEKFYREHGAHIRNQSLQNDHAIRELVSSCDGLIYLCHEARKMTISFDDGSVDLDIFGSPYSIASGKWAFGYDAFDAEEIWSNVPTETDILATHSPPFGVCDVSRDGHPDGCLALLQKLSSVRPRLHLCGHRHEGRGAQQLQWSNGGPGLTKILQWSDPARNSPQKMSLVDLTGKKREQSWSETDCTDLNRHFESPVTSSGNTSKETTCVVNAAIMAKSYTRGKQKEFNKPIVVDIDLPLR